MLGIGLAKKIDELEIHWPAPSKQIAKFTDVPVNGYIRVLEDGGIRDPKSNATDCHRAEER